MEAVRVSLSLMETSKDLVIKTLDSEFPALRETVRELHDYDLPDWASSYKGAMESALGEAYTEPAADVRGYIQYVKSQ